MSVNQDILEPIVEFVQDAQKLLLEAKRPDVKGEWKNASKSKGEAGQDLDHQLLVYSSSMLLCEQYLNQRLTENFVGNRIYQDSGDHCVHVFHLWRNWLCCAAIGTSHEAHPHRWMINRFHYYTKVDNVNSILDLDYSHDLQVHYRIK